MAWWKDLTSEQPEFADAVRARFTIGKHCTLATLRKDGAPRISGSEVQFDDDGGLYVGSMTGGRKSADLQRDPRFALHSPTLDAPEDDPAGWGGDAKISGIAHRVADDRFQLELTEVVLTKVAPSADHLVIESWHPGRGLERVARY